jgi:hypothetical protein
MKNKVFSLMAVALFMISTVNVNANTQKDVLDNPDCWALADSQEASFNSGMVKLRKIPTHLESFLVWEAAYLGCI